MDYKKDFQNHKTRKEKIPANLDELLWEASQHVTVVMPVTSDQRAVFAIGDARAGLKKRNKPTKPQPAAAVVKETTPSAYSNKPDKPRKGRTPDHILDNPSYWKDKDCNLCHKRGHPQARCPDLAKAAEESEEEEAPVAPAPKPAGKPKKKNGANGGNFAMMLA